MEYLKFFLLVALAIFLVFATTLFLDNKEELRYYKDKYELLDQALTSEHTSQNCLEISQETVNRLEQVGIQAEVVKGQTPTTENEHWGHAWVGVWFEPQTGTFAKKYYKTEKSNENLNRWD